MSSVPSLHVVVRGRVQGVGFRWFVRETAVRLDLAGWVRNRDDGAVEVAADGEPGALTRLRAALVSGPSGAAVESVEPAPVDAAAPPRDRPFAIVR